MYDRNAVPSFVREFLDYMATIRGRSENTVASYCNDLKSFLRFMKIKRGAARDVPFEEIEVLDVTAECVKNVGLYDILEFLHFLSSERRNSPKARSRRAVALRQFYKYLTNNKHWFEVSPAQNLEMPGVRSPLPKHLTLEQASGLLSACAGKGFAPTRDYCITTFFLNCGMRLSELVGLNVQDYKEEDENGQTVRYVKVTGKGSKERVIYLNGACARAYAKYEKAREKALEKTPDAAREKAMFLSNRLTRISARRVEQIVTEKLKLCGLDGLGFSVHKLRHTAATLMYRNGVDVRVLKDVLGHENLGTTQIYTHVSNEQVKRAINSNPLAGVKTAEE
ncbi:MAG: tyrosine-type recombinase/integrase [Oscillospiraceae bacterium]|jgi:site-specific recombinase XerD|nr:tyrosine-type recombinase/integrase [Oscillospiraceae bacterium]